jgi:hypothetical protein
MQGARFIDEANLDLDSATTRSHLRVVIAYRDLAASQRALRVMADLGQGLGDKMEFHPVPWSFELLADADWSDAASRDAIDADILIIASSSVEPLPPAVARWIETAISHKRGTAAAVVALFGAGENPDASGLSRLAAIQAAARRAGLDFFSPAPRQALDEALANIQRRAEMVTPLLEEILRRHPPAPRWGINE